MNTNTRQPMNPVLNGNIAEQAKTEASKNRKTFSILKATGHKKEGLIRSFLVVQSISRFDRHITTREGTQWPVFHEPELQDAFKKQEEIKCIVSFQSFADGEFFAIARLYKENQVGKQTKTEIERKNDESFFIKNQKT